MSDFLNFVDEVIDGQPEYNVTQKPNGKYDIELVNEVIQEGTRINKLCLDPINNAIGYSQPNYTLDALPDSNLIFELGTYSKDDIVNNNFNIPIIIRELTPSSGAKVLSESILQIYDCVIVSSQYNSWVDIPNNIYSFDVYMKNNKFLYGSNADDPRFSDWTMILNGSNVSQGYHTITNTYKHYMLYTSTPEFSRWTNFLVKNSKKANYTLERQAIFNNSIINICVPNINDNIVDNTFNNKQLDTLLKFNKYYELLYDQQNDRFIAHEARN